MKHYSLKLKHWDDTILDDESEGVKVYPRANGDKITNSNGFLSKGGEIGKIFFENVVDNAPIFDYFYLYSSTYQKEYDWILLDAYSFIGSNVPSCRGFLVSKSFKELLEQFNIAEPYRFYESRLMYQGEKLEYYIFHLAQNEWNEFNFKHSNFYVKDKKIETTIKSNRDLKLLLREYPNLKMDVCLDHYSDIFYFAHFGYVVSEKLKVAIENSKLLDIEFVEIQSATFSFQSAAKRIN